MVVKGKGYVVISFEFKFCLCTLASCVTLGQLLNPSVPKFSYL